MDTVMQSHFPAEVVGRWDHQYADGRHVRYWPSEDLVRFMGTKGAPSNLKRRSELNILDLGCGTGANTRLFLEQGYSVCGMDFSREAIEAAKRFLANRALNRFQQVRLAHDSVLELPERWVTQFHGVIDIQTLQHIPYSAHATVYRQIYNNLQVGGWFFSVHMGHESWDAKHGGGQLIEPWTYDNMSSSVAIYPNNGLICLPTRPALSQVLREAGFNNVSMESMIRTCRNETRSTKYYIIAAHKD